MEGKEQGQKRKERFHWVGILLVTGIGVGLESAICG